MSLVFFDFDGTLTTSDTIWPFASLLCGNGGRHASRHSVLCSLLTLKLRLTSNHQFKEQLLQKLVQGQPETFIRKQTDEFHASQLEPVLNHSVVRSLLDHVDQGDQVYLVSSNFDFFLEPLLCRWRLKGIFATQAEVRYGYFTGRIVGRACDGEEKLDRVRSHFDERSIREAVAYGDSRGDAALLASVGTAHWIGQRLRFDFPRIVPPA